MAWRVLALLLLLVASHGIGQEEQEQLVLVGSVTKIVDGDTIDVRLDGDDETTRIRMQGIDAPETDQPMTDDAVALLRSLLRDGEVEIQPAGQTSYDRIVARVYVDGVDANAQMVKRGLAMAERRYLREFDDGADYCVFEHAARTDKRGIWRLPPNQRVAPWEWRDGADSFTDYTNETVKDCIDAIGAARATARRSAQRNRAQPGSAPAFTCGTRPTCGQIATCDEAEFQLKECGMSGLDRDKDGVPCEDVCR